MQLWASSQLHRPIMKHNFPRSYFQALSKLLVHGQDYTCLAKLLSYFLVVGTQCHPGCTLGQDKIYLFMDSSMQVCGQKEWNLNKRAVYRMTNHVWTSSGPGGGELQSFRALPPAALSAAGGLSAWQVHVGKIWPIMQMNFAYQFPISTQPVTKLQRYFTSRVSCWRLGTYVALGKQVCSLVGRLACQGSSLPGPNCPSLSFNNGDGKKKIRALGKVESEEPGIRCHCTTTTFNPT